MNLKGLVTLCSMCYEEMEAGLSSLTAFAALLTSPFRSARQQAGPVRGGWVTGLQHRSVAADGYRFGCLLEKLFLLTQSGVGKAGSTAAGGTAAHGG